MSDEPRMNAYWGWPLNSQRAHLFQVDAEGKAGLISICGKMMFAGAKDSDPWTGTFRRGQDCMACVKKAQKHDAKLAKA